MYAVGDVFEVQRGVSTCSEVTLNSLSIYNQKQRFILSQPWSTKPTRTCHLGKGHLGNL